MKILAAVVKDALPILMINFNLEIPGFLRDPKFKEKGKVVIR